MRFLTTVAGIVATAITMSGCAERLLFSPTRQATPAPTFLVPDAEAFWFASGDGTRLRGWLLPAQTGDARNAPTVFHVHGNAASMNEHLYFVSELPAAGFNVFMFDYRGYGESESAATSREELLDDATTALRTLRARADIDSARIAVFAQSLGAAIAIVLVQEDLARIDSDAPRLRGVGLESPVASFRDVAANAVGGDPPNFIGASLAACLIRDGCERMPRPVDAIRTIDLPIFIVHGDADTTVPVSHGRRLADAAPDAELLICPGGKHNSLQETHPDSRTRMIAFLRAVTTL
ncbi:MAG: alpha/beta fold hydrolase [Phycisphaerae bacterium]|nr:alpha/beta fold hydrolase [Phycisphaerae bacterium]